MITTKNDLPRETSTELNLYCLGCGDGPFSACYLDYYFMQDEEEFTCNECGELLILARERSELVVQDRTGDVQDQHGNWLGDELQVVQTD